MDGSYMAGTWERSLGPQRETSLIASVSAAHFVSHVHLMSLPAIMPFAAAYFKVSLIEVGVALTLFNIVSLAVQTPIGFIVDRFDPWHFLIAALILGGLSFISLAFYHPYQWLLVTMVLAGIANGVYHPSDYALLSSNIPEQRIGRAYSIHTFVGFLGNAATPLLLVGAATLAGTQYAFVVAGSISLLVALYLQRAKPIKSLQSTFPQKNEAIQNTYNVLSPAVLMFATLFIFLNLSTSGIQAFSVSALIALGSGDLSNANLALSLYLSASALGILAGGMLADRTSHHGGLAALAMAIAAVATIYVYYVTPSGFSLWAAFSVAGFCSGIITPSRDILVRGVSPRGAEGRVFGVVSTGFNIGGALSPILFGWLVDHGHNRELFGLTAIFMLITVAFTLIPAALPKH